MDKREIAQLAQNPEAVQQAKEALTAVLTRSATDADFRKSLLEQPRSALKNFFGVEVPESYNVKFIENQADATVVLPDPVNLESELSESELTTVAGGIEPMTIVATIMLTVFITNGVKKLGDDGSWFS